MDEFQATPPQELRRLRAVSAQQFADKLLVEALSLLNEKCGQEALQELRRRIATQISEVPDHSPGDDRCARIAMEEIDRAVQLATTGTTMLLGWTDEAPPSVEEEKPE